MAAFDPLKYPGCKTGVTSMGETATARAREVCCLLREDARAPHVPEDRRPVSRAAAAECTTLQLEVLYASQELLKLCQCDPSRGPRKHLVAVANAFLEHPTTVDQLLCSSLACCPYVGTDKGEAAWWVEKDDDMPGTLDYFDSRDEAAAAARAWASGPTPVQANRDFLLAMIKGPVGLLHELFTHAPHPVLAEFCASPFWPDAAAVLVRHLRFATSEDRLPALLASLAASALGRLAAHEPTAAASVAAALDGDGDARSALETAAKLDDGGDARSARAALKKAAAALLHRATADAAAPPHIDRRCLACAAPTTTKCSRCKAVFFCDNEKKCLAAVWYEHKHHCRPAAKPKADPQ